MKKLLLPLLICYGVTTNAQKNNAALAVGVAAATTLTFIAANAAKKETAKTISQFRSKEFIINKIIGDAGNKEIKFETESLASDDSGGLISIAFNCDEINERGLLLAFFGENRDENGYFGNAYAFRYLPLEEAKNVLERLEKVRENNSKYLSESSNVNNVFVQHKDLKFVFYRENGNQIRVFWNGFEVIWEQVAFDRTKRRLNKWFNK
ncbi:hypothetical protein EG359_14890 [Chryseobacterium joostei]|uniref:Uncharacterized protein n=1 Tax=Chryseobacterium joostei TaxID=112234 RepID=A0A1N7I7S2_9FLAO|nr:MULTISPECIES: hypothetical protein [Chryseobacterium]AZB00818.1 hypothetical protein EG359_14890 [Chryseobacterium joostei]SIS33123.1 hypothetical protein SAMN05421768_103168 [Chryseobacterium joostei]HCM34946.1 hypothetical protein [Chryseobacterium sp.]